MSRSARYSNTPEWVSAMSPGAWHRLSGNNPDLNLTATPPGTRYLADGDPACDPRLNPSNSVESRLRRLIGRYVKAPWSGLGDFRSITESWNGAILASGFGESGSMICFGGGHNDYFGSDVHAFDLATRQWSRISDGFISSDHNAYGAGACYPNACYPDGSPLPPHTYGYLQYDDMGNDLLLLKGQQELGPNVIPTPIPHMFNLDTRQWRHGPKHPTAALKSAGWSAWDSNRRTLWGNSGNDGNTFIGFCPDGDNNDGTFGHWGHHYPSKTPAAADHNCMAYDSKRDLLLIVDHTTNTLLAMNPARPADQAVVLNSKPSVAISPYAAIEYSELRDCFIYYSAMDGCALYSIHAPSGDDWQTLKTQSWQWQSLVAPHNALNPIEDATNNSRYQNNNINHTFGRFRIARFGDEEVAILVRHIDSPVYAMKLGRHP